LIRKQINSLISAPYVSISHVDIANELAIETNHIDFSHLWSKERGTVNHYTEEGNREIFKKLEEIIGE
jgi:hypothetical protein